MIANNDDRVLWLPGASEYEERAYNWDGDGGSSRNASGLKVDPDTALQCTVVLACARALGESIATLPLHIYERLPDGGKRIAHEHPLYKRLHSSPNGFQTSFEWREQQVLWMCLWGNSYNLIVPGLAGFASELQPLHPSRMTAARIENGRIRYTYKTENNSSEIYSQDQILHIKWLSDDSLTGLQPVKLAKNAIGLAMALELHGSKYFANGAKPGFVLSTDNEMKAEAAATLRDNWEQHYRGAANSNKVAVLSGGLKPIMLGGANMVESTLNEIRRFQIEEICRLYRVPPHLVGDLSRSSFSNIEQQSIDYLQHTLLPWCRRFEDAFGKSLILETDTGPKFFAEFDTRGMLRGDAGARASYYNTLYSLGVASINEIRAWESLNSVEGGDTRFVSLGVQPLATIAAGPAPVAPAPGAPVPGAPVAPVAPAPTDTAESEPQVADVSLNGAQINGMVAILMQMSEGLLTGEGAAAFIAASFPSISPDKIQTIVSNVIVKAAPAPAPAPAPQQAVASRIFCATGDKGGIDNSCGNEGGGSGDQSTPRVGVSRGIHINDKHQDFTGQILSGVKTSETRNSNSLKSFIGKTVGIIRTGTGNATLVGTMKIGEPKFVSTKKEFDNLFDSHQVSPKSKHYITSRGKYVYPLTDVKRIEEVDVSSFKEGNRVYRKLRRSLIDMAVASRIFCPTGDKGGIDNSCGKEGGGEGGSDGTLSPQSPEWKQPVDKNGRPIPIKAKSMGHAMKLVLDGKVVELPDEKSAHTLIDRLANQAVEAKKAGKEAKDFDLCNVSVAGSNLFCGDKLITKEHPEGIPRVAMPQLSGEPVKGSEAEKLSKLQGTQNQVDAAKEFVKHLQEKGIKTTTGTIAANKLKASQSQLSGQKISAMMNDRSFQPGKEPIFVTRDNYVVDGHHRWAAVVGRDLEDGTVNGDRISIVRIDAPISEVLQLANRFGTRFGIAKKVVKAKGKSGAAAPSTTAPVPVEDISSQPLVDPAGRAVRSLELRYGTASSGNHGHQGRPGEVGGSGGGGGGGGSGGKGRVGKGRVGSGSKKKEPTFSVPKLLKKIASSPFGFTLSATTSNQPKTGIMVSTFKNDSLRSIKIPKSQFSSPAAAEKLRSFINSNRSLLLHKKNMFIGGWLIKGKHFYLDVATRFKEKDALKALQRGRKAKQFAVFNLRTFKETYIKYSPGDKRRPRGWQSAFDHAVKVTKGRSQKKEMHDNGGKTVRSNNPSARDVVTTEGNNIENGEEKNKFGGHRSSQHTGEGVGRRHLPSNAEILRVRSGEGRGQTAPRLVQERSAEHPKVAKRYGTKESGNYGHQGRPNEVGGSGGGGNEPVKVEYAEQPTVSPEELKAAGGKTFSGPVTPQMDVVAHIVVQHSSSSGKNPVRENTQVSVVPHGKEELKIFAEYTGSGYGVLSGGGRPLDPNQVPMRYSDEVRETLAGCCGLDPPLPKDEKEAAIALHNSALIAHDKVNAILQNSEVDLGGMELHRGVKVSPDKVQELIDGLSDGTMETRTIQSWSKNITTPAYFAGGNFTDPTYPIPVMMHVSNVRRGLDVNQYAKTDIVVNDDVNVGVNKEQEIILPSTQYRVRRVKVYKNGDEITGVEVFLDQRLDTEYAPGTKFKEATRALRETKNE